VATVGSTVLAKGSIFGWFFGVSFFLICVFIFNRWGVVLEAAGFDRLASEAVERWYCQL